MPEANTRTIKVMTAMGCSGRERISEHTCAGLAAVKARGVVLTNPNLHLVRSTNTTAATRERSRRSAERATQLAEIENEADHSLNLQQIGERLNVRVTRARASDRSPRCRCI